MIFKINIAGYWSRDPVISLIFLSWPSHCLNYPDFTSQRLHAFQSSRACRSVGLPTQLAPGKCLSKLLFAAANPLCPPSLAHGSADGGDLLLSPPPHRELSWNTFCTGAQNKRLRLRGSQDLCQEAATAECKQMRVWLCSHKTVSKNKQ